MAYDIIITDRAEELMDKIISYLIFKLKNEQAAYHFFDCTEAIYNRLEENPHQFSLCRDIVLESKGYREAIFPDMEYKIIFKIVDKQVYVLGVFHSLENYRNKV